MNSEVMKKSEENELALTLKDLQTFQRNLIFELSELLDKKLVQQSPPQDWNTMRSRDVRKKLGISASTLQAYRISGLLRAKKVGGTYYYDRRDMKKFEVK